MLIVSLFTSWQAAFSNPEAQAQPAANQVEEASILDTSPHSFQDEVPLGDVESYTLSFTDDNSHHLVGQMTLVKANPVTHVYVDMDMAYSQVALWLGTCAEPMVETYRFDSSPDATQPLVIDSTLEELLHPRYEYVMRVTTPTAIYCAEL